MERTLYGHLAGVAAVGGARGKLSPAARQGCSSCSTSADAVTRVPSDAVEARCEEAGVVVHREEGGVAHRTQPCRDR